MDGADSQRSKRAQCSLADGKSSAVLHPDFRALSRRNPAALQGWNVSGLVGGSRFRVRLWISSCGSLQGSAAPDHGRTAADIRGVDAWPITVSVTDAFPDMCGPMSALRIQLEPGAADAALVIRDGGELQSIVGAPEGHLFAGFAYSGVRFFADASLAMVDIRERAATYFDVKKRFAGAVPVVMY